MQIVCHVPKAGLVHFLVDDSPASLDIGHLPVKRAVPAHCRSRSGVENGRADQAEGPDHHEDDSHCGNPDSVAVRSDRPAQYGTRTN